MFAILNNPDYWNKRAEKVVIRLAQARDQDERAKLLRLHADYVRIACAAAVRANGAYWDLPVNVSLVFAAGKNRKRRS